VMVEETLQGGVPGSEMLLKAQLTKPVDGFVLVGFRSRTRQTSELS
jgi:hypothetical protein